MFVGVKCKHRFILFIFVFCLTSLVPSSAPLEWIVDDAVYITPESESDETEIETRSPDEFSPNTTRTKGTGEEPCIKLKECYPILFLSDRKEPEPSQPLSPSVNSDLVEFILETSTTCDPDGKNGTAATTISGSSVVFGSVQDPGNTYIRCHLKTISGTRGGPTYRPVVVEGKAEPEESECGQISKIISTTRSDDGKGGGLLQKQEERVVGGTEAKVGEAPYVVVMTFKGKQVCGGSVLDEFHILTASHCVSHLKPTVLQYLRFFIGEHNIKDSKDVEHQERNVSKIIYHRDFSTDTLHDDIAMVKLSEPIQYTSTVSPVCLADGSQPIDDGNTYGRLVGWGQLEEGGERPLTPRKADLRIWQTEDCEDVYDGIVPEDLMEKAFCAGGFQDGGETDACKGDSGGPLTITKNNRVEQVGIVSFGIGCGRYPGVFTKVSEYIAWIDRHRSRYFKT